MNEGKVNVIRRLLVPMLRSADEHTTVCSPKTMLEPGYWSTELVVSVIWCVKSLSSLQFWLSNIYVRFRLSYDVKSYRDVGFPRCGRSPLQRHS